MTVKELISNQKNFIKDDLDLIERAYNFAKRAHQGQKRRSGDPYFIHAYETAKQVSEWRLDAQTISAALLHDVAEDTKFTLDNIKEEFGEEISFLVDGVTKLGRVKYRESRGKPAARKFPQFLQQFFFAYEKARHLMFSYYEGDPLILLKSPANLGLKQASFYEYYLLAFS